MKTQDSKIQTTLTKADLSKIIGGNSNPVTEEENATSAEQRTGDVAPILIGGVLIGAGG